MDDDLVFEFVLGTLSRASCYIGQPNLEPYEQGGKIVVPRFLEPHELFGCEIEYVPETLFSGKVIPNTKGMSPLEFRGNDKDLSF